MLRRETGECSRRPGLNTRGQRRESNREEMGEYLIRYLNELVHLSKYDLYTKVVWRCYEWRDGMPN